MDETEVETYIGENMRELVLFVAIQEYPNCLLGTSTPLGKKRHCESK